MKKTTFEGPANLDSLLGILDSKREQLLIIDFHRNQIWSSNERSELSEFDFSGSEKVYFAENDQQANDAFQVILSEQSSSDAGRAPAILALVRPER